MQLRADVPQHSEPMPVLGSVTKHNQAKSGRQTSARASSNALIAPMRFPAVTRAFPSSRSSCDCREIRSHFRHGR